MASTGVLAGGLTSGLGCGSRAGEPASASAPSAPSRIEELAERIAHVPRKEILDQIAAEITGGLDLELLHDALYLAATRAISTRAGFGAPQHSLLLTPAMLEISRTVAPRDASRPLLWWLDFFKWGQSELPATDRPMLPAESLRPVAAANAESALRDAIESLDGDLAERAILALVESQPRLDVVAKLLLLYGSKDLTHIGHKAIHAANACRFLAATKWQHAEPVFRSIALTLALPETERSPGEHSAAWAKNQARARRLPSTWPAGSSGDDPVPALLALFRSAGPDEASEEVVGWANRGASAQSMWDAMHLSSAELMLAYPEGISALHAVTASNAARYAYATCDDPMARRLVLLQNAARVADFHRYVKSFDKQRAAPSLAIETLEPDSAGRQSDALDGIFWDIGQDAAARLRAVQRALSYLDAGEPAVQSLKRRAATVAIAKANDSHDFKIPVAVLEDFAAISPRWRTLYLAACVARFRSSSVPDTRLSLPRPGRAG